MQKNLDLKSKSFDLSPIYRLLNSIITNDNCNDDNDLLQLKL